MKNHNSLERIYSAIAHKQIRNIPILQLLSTEIDPASKDVNSLIKAITATQISRQKEFNFDNFFIKPSIDFEAKSWLSNIPILSAKSNVPLINSFKEISKLQPPTPEKNQTLNIVLKVIEQLKLQTDNIPVIGLVTSPFSLPVKQLGLGKYLELLHNFPELFSELIEKNIKFCADWAKTQLSHGASAICFYDPLANSTFIPPELYRETGLQIAKKVIAKIENLTISVKKKGSCLPTLEKLLERDTFLITFHTPPETHLGYHKSEFRILNNFEPLELNKSTSEQSIKEALAQMPQNGGIILTDFKPTSFPQLDLAKLKKLISFLQKQSK